MSFSDIFESLKAIGDVNLAEEYRVRPSMGKFAVFKTNGDDSADIIFTGTEEECYAKVDELKKKESLTEGYSAGYVKGNPYNADLIYSVSVEGPFEGKDQKYNLVNLTLIAGKDYVDSYAYDGLAWVDADQWVDDVQFEQFVWYPGEESLDDVFEDNGYEKCERPTIIWHYDEVKDDWYRDRNIEKRADAYLKEDAGIPALIKPITVKEEFTYDFLDNMDEDEVEIFEKLGFIKDNKAILPVGTKLKYVGSYGRQLIYNIIGTEYDLYFNNLDGMFEREFDDYFRIDEELKESWSDASYKDYESIDKFVRENDGPGFVELVDYEDGPLDTSIITVKIDGDWKHDHARFDYLVKQWANNNNRRIIKIDKKTIEDTGSDWYPAYHVIYIAKDDESYDMLNKMRPLFANESLDEDTIKQNGKWVNKGKEGTHGKFETKKAADAQRKAMFANGYKEELKEDLYDELEDPDSIAYYYYRHPYDLYDDVLEGAVDLSDGVISERSLKLILDKTDYTEGQINFIRDRAGYWDEDVNLSFVDNRKNAIIHGGDDYGFDEYDVGESLTEDKHFDYYDQEVKKGGYTEEEIAKVISIADDYESKANKGVITYDQMDEVASQMGLEEMSDSELRRAWDMYYDILSRESFRDDGTSDNLDNYKKYSDACSAFAEVINREARRRKEAGNYNPDNESLNEADYGGAFDIENDQFFTKEELMEFIYSLAEEFSDWVEDEVYITDLAMITPTHLTASVALKDEGADFTADVDIDMRRIRKPSHIYKYSDDILNQWKESYKEYHDLEEAVKNPNFDREKYGRFFDENDHLIPELAKEYFDLVHQEQKAQYDFSVKGEEEVKQ